MAARVCFLLEGGHTLPPVLKTLTQKSDARFLYHAKVTQVGYTIALRHIYYRFGQASALIECHDTASLIRSPNRLS